MTTLRDYQQWAVNKAIQSIEARKSGIVVAPTGSGKSVMIDALVRRFPNAVVIVNEKTVKSQLRERLPSDTKIFSPTNYNPNPDNYNPSIDPSADPIYIIDEIHHFRRDRAWGRVFNSGALVIGFSATPVWTIELSIPVICRIPYYVLRDQGWLAPPLTGMISTSQEETDTILKKSDCRHTVFYISSKDDWQSWMGRLITASTPVEERAFLNEDRICNIATLTTGWDNSDIDSVVLCRSIGEAHTYLQILGRLRRGGVVVDMSNNILRFGLDEDIISSQIGNKGAPSSNTDNLPICKRCLGCQRLLAPRQQVCPFCGWKAPAMHKSGKLWTALENETIDKTIKALSKDITNVEKGYTFRFTPSGAYPEKMWNGETAYISARTLPYWKSVRTRLESIKDGLQNGTMEGIFYVPKTWWILAVGKDGQLMYGCDMSYGSNLIWQKLG